MQREARRHIRDFQRKRLYEAERGVPEGLVWASLLEAQSYLDRLLASPWWQMHFPSVRCVVLFAQEGKYAVAHKGVHGGAIQLPHWALNQLTLVHELAHLASPPETIGHGPAFAGIYLLLVHSTAWTRTPPSNWSTISPLAACRCRHTRGHAITGFSCVAGVWHASGSPHACSR